METISAQYKARELPRISEGEASRRHLLSEVTLQQMHLMPSGAPVARGTDKSGNEICYFAPNKVKEAPPAEWYGKQPKQLPANEPGGELRRVSPRRAAALGYYPAEVLARMYYQPSGTPVAYYIKKSGERVELYDRAACARLPLPCAKCGAGTRYRAKLCRTCYQKELVEKRAAGDKRRAAYYGMDPTRVLFFDLELTGVYDHDEILSVSIVNGNGETVLDTLTRPVRQKRWKRTEKIHGITPEMVKDAPTLADITPQLLEILDGAERLIAFGTATDFSHLRRIYGTREERTRLHDKLLDCAAEFSHYIHEHEVELTHLSLTDAMAHFSLPWEGTAHTSAADTNACRRVFERLFPHYYESEAI